MVRGRVVQASSEQRGRKGGKGQGLLTGRSSTSTSFHSTNLVFLRLHLKACVAESLLEGHAIHQERIPQATALQESRVGRQAK